MGAWESAAWWLGGALASGGVVLLLLALFRDRARGRRRCPKCWYDMAGTPGMTCPECGRMQKKERGFGRTRRHRGRAAAAVLLMLVGAGTAVAPAAVTGEWATYTPTPVLRLVLPLFSEHAEHLGSECLKVGLPPTPSGFERLLLAQYCSMHVRQAIVENDPGLLDLSAWGRSPLAMLIDSLGVELKVVLPDLYSGVRQEDSAVAVYCVNVLLDLCRSGKLNEVDMRSLLVGGQFAHTRRCGAMLLSVSGKASEQSLRALRRHAETDDAEDVRVAACESLGALSPDSTETVRILRSAAARGGPASRVILARVLGVCAQTVAESEAPQWVSMQGTPQLETETWESAPDAVAALAGLLDDTEIKVRREAASCLAGVGIRATPVVHEIRAALDAEADTSTRQLLITAYVAQPTTDVAFLLDGLVEDLLILQHNRRTWAARSLRACGERAAPVVPRLLELAQQLDWQDRDRFCWVLSGLGKPGLNVLETWVREHPDERSPAWWIAYEAKANAAAVELLEGFLQSPDPRLRIAAIMGIAQGDVGPSLQPLLLRARRTDPDGAVRLEALHATGRSEDTDWRTRFWIDALTDSDHSVRGAAFHRLRSVGVPSGDAVAELRALAGHPDEAVSAPARDLLERWTRED